MVCITSSKLQDIKIVLTNMHKLTLDSSTMDTASEKYVQDVAQELCASFKDPSNLLGVYLHGSPALGGYNVRTSDIDIIAVCKMPMTIAEKDAVATRLSRTNLKCPAEGLELNIVTLDTIQTPSQESPYELQITTFPNDAKAVDGAGRPGDPRLVLDFAICRQSGRPIGERSLPCKQIFTPISKDMVLAQVKREVDWGLKLHKQGYGEYAVLNSCRAWKFHHDGILVSKIEGDEWVLSTQSMSNDERNVIEAALQWHKSGVEVPLDQEVAKEFG